MGIFEDRSIILDDNIANVEDWLTPGEAINIFISAGYQLEFKEEYHYLTCADNVISMDLRKITNPDSSKLPENYFYKMILFNFENEDFTKAVFE
ncbi:hypothetical protein C1903_12440 [Listeria ivanovii]|uniref:hypothetical protein n=1 Tax=Listeria ivanovii TaxID=1638 RepID=UPI000DA755B1|nr:hypothetical protein [Listeria ivanovii]PZF87485.1 hypothetical protein C1905_12710 [Listeria ivanovii]PZF92534.1 hypothetical protein C1903_12440 [Listeria ivanovii]PZG03617.1 hypothetical protein C2L88_12380 [Listeria ivanovii]PZG07880.1 hypothetical protein C1901_12425 [Listeria ivanovii]PZG24764.1 hypothetical protein C1900_12680 [Listeria ivanovii]